jgi:hypothetical protein
LLATAGEDPALHEQEMTLGSTPTGNHTEGEQEYEAPKLFEIGGVYDLTLKGCKVKKGGGGNGLKFPGISVSSC